jgi:hypothetical protein
LAYKAIPFREGSAFPPIKNRNLALVSRDESAYSFALSPRDSLHGGLGMFHANVDGFQKLALALGLVGSLVAEDQTALPALMEDISQTLKIVFFLQNKANKLLNQYSYKQESKRKMFSITGILGWSKCTGRFPMHLSQTNHKHKKKKEMKGSKKDKLYRISVQGHLRMLSESHTLCLRASNYFFLPLSLNLLLGFPTTFHPI